jgi:hypothetical protein
MSEYPYDSERMCNAYENLFRNLLARREEMLRRRRWTSASAWKLRMRASAYDTCHRWLLAIESSRSRVLGRLTGHDRKTDSGGS